jgi:hypothetical protein
VDSDDLQALLDRSADAAGPHLRRTFELPEHALGATALGTYTGPRAQWFLPFQSAGTGVYVRITVESLLAWAADPLAFPK